MKQVTILIAEDQLHLALSLKEKIELKPIYKVRYIAANGQELLEELERNASVDILFLDIEMPILNGLDTLKQINARFPHIKVLMFTVFEDERSIFEAIRNGASGYISKTEKPKNLHAYMQDTLNGGAPMSPLIAKKALELIKAGYKVPEKKEEIEISARERECLESLSRGLTYEQIAHNFNISYNTIRTHFQNIYRKLNVRNKTEAIHKFYNQ